MKNILMPSQYGLTSMRHDTCLSFGTRVILADGPAARLRRDNQLQQEIQLQQDKSVRIQALASRPAALVAFAATGAEAVPAPEVGDYAVTKHTGNGGWRGPHPWGQPPVII
ncbi:hypothetical protein AB0395_01340 [Streptosporangium sp. NPDC051023]|uniref:hypothetical protein n=1 Tax=Streptosporangium sp. NPDC051023 TaxID=3155410 RepID=UPI00344BD60E